VATVSGQPLGEEECTKKTAVLASILTLAVARRTKG
jgi:hypothetical protein